MHSMLQVRKNVTKCTKKCCQIEEDNTRRMYMGKVKSMSTVKEKDLTSKSTVPV